MNKYNKLREWLSEQEHIQWEHWSKEIAHRLERWCNDDWSKLTFKENAAEQIKKWKVNWKPYKNLPKEIKEYDREWADKILENIPFKCPMYQCGGLMFSKELPSPAIPSGKSSLFLPFGYIQSPDLVCSNCGAVYHFVGFKHKKLLNAASHRKTRRRQRADTHR